MVKMRVLGVAFNDLQCSNMPSAQSFSRIVHEFRFLAREIAKLNCEMTHPSNEINAIFICPLN